jgi:hypothetical protein
MKDDSLYDSDYFFQFQKLTTKILKRNVNVTQLYNKDVIVRETKVYETIYTWDEKLKKLVIKSKKII